LLLEGAPRLFPSPCIKFFQSFSFSLASNIGTLTRLFVVSSFGLPWVRGSGHFNNFPGLTLFPPSLRDKIAVPLLPGDHFGPHPPRCSDFFFLLFTTVFLTRSFALFLPHGAIAVSARWGHPTLFPFVSPVACAVVFSGRLTRRLFHVVNNPLFRATSLLLPFPHLEAGTRSPPSFFRFFFYFYFVTFFLG